MDWINRRSAWICFAVLLSGLVEAGDPQRVLPNQVGLSAERLQRLDKVLQSYVEQDQLPGSVVLVAKGGKIAHFKSFGWLDKEAKIPLENDSMFRIASQTKAITSVAIMILQERAQLLISDPVSKYLPEFAQTTVAEDDGEGGYTVVKAQRPITLRDLLTHSAGIGYGFGPARTEWESANIQGWYFSNRDEPVRTTIKRVAALPQNAQPGEAFVYGYNTDILGAVIEVVSRKSLEQFFVDEIFSPLEMKDTSFYLPTDKVERLAVVYSATDEGIARAPTPGSSIGAAYIGQGHYVNGPRKSFSGGAGLISTAEDYFKFLQMLLNDGEFNGQRILSRKSVELMTVDHISAIKFPMPGVGFGLGFSVVKKLGDYGALGSVGSYSWGGAYHSSYWVDPAEALIVVYLTQLLPARKLDDHKKLRALVYQAIVD
jgi:CubicO group peptidase (beta-lactamase class C family)